eukprot:6458242-Amphidinium_carterae.4
MQTEEMRRASQQPMIRVMNPEDQELQQRTEIARIIDSPLGEELTKCWVKSCSASKILQCERMRCRRYACTVHSFSIYLPDGSQ